MTSKEESIIGRYFVEILEPADGPLLEITTPWSEVSIILNEKEVLALKDFLDTL